MKRTSTVFLIFISLFVNLSAQPVSLREKKKPGLASIQPDLFGYQQYDTHILKINVLDMFQRFDAEGFMGKIQLAYEHKLRPSWSLNSELSANYFFAYEVDGQAQLNLHDGILSFQLEPRYYFDMRRRILGRRSKNNFSANYVSLAVSTRLFELRRGLSATDNARFLYADNFGIAPLFGIQRRIFTWLFVDFNLGAKVSFGEPVRTRLFFPKDANQVWQLAPVTYLRLGIAI